MTLETKMTGPQYDGLKNPEEKRELREIERNIPNLDIILEKYAQDRANEEISIGDLPALNSSQINDLIYLLSNYNPDKLKTGLFLRDMIFISIENGNREFELNSFLEFDSILHGIRGPAKIRYVGNLGQLGISSCRNLTAEIYGNVQEMASCEDSKITIHGNSTQPGRSSKNCIFTLYGNIDTSISGKYNCKSCTYQVSEPETFDHLKKHLSKTNQVVLIDKNGNELERRTL